jgi:hypothetical protein|nr:huntingtin-interacting protein M [Castor canadensis]
MSGKKNQENFYKDGSQPENHSSRPDIQLPVSYMYRLLQEEQQYTPCLGSTTTDFLLAMLNYLTDYILELVGTEASNNSEDDNNLPDGEREGDNNCEPPRVFKDASSLFDKMPRPRRNG